MKKVFALSLLGLVSLWAALMSVGCGQSAEAASLNVTYYYLPG